MLCKPTPPAGPVPTSWRSVLPIHPDTELFPLMSADELAELAENIRKDGLREPVTVRRKYRRGADGTYDLELIDGRNRLDAMERAGFALVRDGKLDPNLGHKALGLEPLAGGYAEFEGSDADVRAFIISKNIHRRHLTAEKKRELIGKLLEDDPSKSDREIGKIVKADNKTVASVRAKKEGREEIPHVSKRTDSKGRQQPAKRAKKAPDPPQVSDRLETKVTGLESELEEVKAVARSLFLQLAGAKFELEKLKREHRFHDITGKDFLAVITELDMPVVWSAEEIIAEINHPNLTPEHLRRAAELLHYIADALVARMPPAAARAAELTDDPKKAGIPPFLQIQNRKPQLEETEYATHVP